MESSKNLFFARGKTASSANISEILDSSDDFIEDSPEPSPVVLSKTASKILDKSKHQSESKSNCPEKEKGKAWKNKPESGLKASNDHNVIGASDSDESDDVPLLAINTKKKSVVISSDSEDLEDFVGINRYRIGATKNLQNSYIFPHEDDSPQKSKAVSTPSGNDDCSGTRSSNGTTKSYTTAAENLSSKTNFNSLATSSNGTTPSFKTARTDVSSPAPFDCNSRASDSIVWSEPRRNKHLIHSASDSENEESGDKSYASKEKFDMSVKITPPPSSSEESFNDDYQPANLNIKLFDSDIELSGDDFNSPKASGRDPSRPQASISPENFKFKQSTAIQSEFSSARRTLAELRNAGAGAKNLPDGGKQLMLKIGKAGKDLAKKEAQAKMINLVAGEQSSASSHVNQAWQAQRRDLQGFGMSAEERAKMLGEFGQDNMYGGRMNQSRRQEVRSVTMDALKAMHTSLETMPAEGNMEEQPLGLRSSIQLFPHQKQALSWLLWRETQHPAGGILADDMGLGKTLTMISLILKHRELEYDMEKARRERGEEEKVDNWIGKGSELVRSKSTLLVCPASLLGQWEKEVDSKVKSGRLRVLVYHGNNRKCSARALARYDVVITTYGTVQSEVKAVLGDKADKDAKTKMDDLVAAEDVTSTKGLSELLGVAWERIILDEAHQIRNPKSLTSQAVCRLRAERRWCLSGTPIQNKELDLYALVRFIRCSPFDEYRIWKVWIDNKSAQGQQRMNTLVRSLLLRRTKETKSQLTGKVIVDLPEKIKTEHKIELTPEERKVYLEVFSFSQAALKKYMDQNEERQEMKELGISGSGSSRTERVAEDFSHRTGVGSEMEQPEDVKAHHILVLLLRLRQICCHPGLIKSMLDTETKASEGLQDDNGEELDLISAMEDMSVGETKPEQKILDMANPVFENKRISSKINTVVEELKELKRKGRETGLIEKTVIVSQWTSMLQIIKVHVEAIGMRCAEINGHVAVKLRGNIVDQFNNNAKGPEVMLLSLAAGGVGLNLVGANHLFLLDMHWNPQLEAQACDRIYRVGQKKEVKIHRFVVKDSVEEKILLLQEKKLGLAEDVLTGAKRSGANKLSMDDLKMLFQVN